MVKSKCFNERITTITVFKYETQTIIIVSIIIHFPPFLIRRRDVALEADGVTTRRMFVGLPQQLDVVVRMEVVKHGTTD